jgi:class 3 adenylate cyclase/TolB-like protein
MSVTRKLAAILAADVAGYSRLIGADEEGTIAQLLGLRRDLIDPAIAAHRGRIVKTTGDGLLIEFASVVDAVRCAVEVQRAMAERNVGVEPERRIEFRVGVNLGDVVVEEGGDLLGDGVNVAARLEGIADPGGIFISRAAYEQIDGKIGVRATDIGDRSLKNIVRPIRTYSIHIDQDKPLGAPAARPQRLSVIVLPFQNLSGDAALDAFADAVTESVTTELARSPDRFVIARNTAFAYKGKVAAPQQLARDLGVRYVVQGAMQSSADRLRINAQLVDADSGTHVWAERFDRARLGMLEAEEEITFHIARSVDIQMREAEIRRANRERPDNKDATDLTLGGWTPWLHEANRKNCLVAHDIFQHAVRSDARNAAALAGLAFMTAMRAMFGWSENLAEDVAAVVALADRALDANATHPYAFFAKGFAFLVQRKPASAAAAFERLVAANPISGSSHANVGFAKICAGQHKDGIGDLRNAIRLSPQDPVISMYYMMLGIGYVCDGAIEEAIKQLEKAVAINGNVEIAHIWLASAYAEADRLDGARQEVDAVLALDAGWSLERFAAVAPLPVVPRVRDALRKAGFPETSR